MAPAGPLMPSTVRHNCRESNGKSLSTLLDEFSTLRSDNLSRLRALNLQPSHLELQGRTSRVGSCNSPATPGYMDGARSGAHPAGEPSDGEALQAGSRSLGGVSVGDEIARPRSNQVIQARGDSGGMSRPVPSSHFTTSHCLPTRASTVWSSNLNTPGRCAAFAAASIVLILRVIVIGRLGL